MTSEDSKYYKSYKYYNNISYNTILLFIIGLFIIIIGLQLFYFYITPNYHKYKFNEYKMIRGTPKDHIIDYTIYHYPNSSYWNSGYELFKNSSLNHKTSLSDHCKSLSDWDRLRDIQCSIEWINVLRYSSIIDIDLMLGFEKGKRNAFRVIFEDGTYGWYKTCPGEGENPEMEVVGYLIDYFLQFKTMAPAVSRKLNIKELEEILIKKGRTDFLDILAHTDYICSSGGEFNGIIIGWWDNLEEVKSPIKKKDAEKNATLHVRHKWSILVNDDSFPIKELPRNHLLLYLLNILQSPGHNEFRIKDGPIVSIDVDRAQFVSRLTSHIGLRYFCKMDKDTYNTLHYFSHESYIPNKLGSLIINALEIYEPQIKFKQQYVGALQLRLETLYSMMKECIEEYGYDDVIYEL